MPQGDWFILMIVGGVFIVLGVVGLIWGWYEEKRLFEALAQQHDLREFSLKHVESPQPGALKMGGWIAIALGVLVLVAGIIFWLLAGS
ncbi:MAG TPA: hypothetical protein VMW86_01685 [Dehalococcoidales bacterium]|nr:hypothetical protein [Dehalococcoidales bacterium]